MRKDFVNNRENVIAALNISFPSHYLYNLTINEFGWSSIVADLDNKLICNFPRNNEKYKALLQERDIINTLKDNINIEFPFRVEVKETPYPFFIHRKIKGEYLSKDDYEKLTQKEKDNFLDSVCDFFIAFHNTENKIHLPEKKILFDDEKEIIKNIKYYFSNKECDDMKDLLKIYKKEAEKPSEQILCYNDFHGYNIVTYNDRKIKGVFDFDKVAVNDRILDLRKVSLNYGWNTGINLLTRYNSKSNKKIDPEKYKLFLIATHLCEFSWMNELDPNLLKEIKSVNFSRHINNIGFELKKIRER